MPRFLLFILFLLLSIKAYAEEEIVIQLPTASSLVPAYVGAVKANQPSVSEKHLKELGDILLFDVNYNGYTQVVQRQDASEKMLSQADWMRQEKFWRSQCVKYVIYPRCDGNQLAIQVLVLGENKLKKFPAVTLSGNLREDAAKVHLISDAFLRECFKKEGVATTHVLYTVRRQIDPKDSTKWIAEVWEADYDGRNPRQLTQDGFLAVTPTYVPPKPGCAVSMYVYVSYQQGQPRIYIAPLKGGKGQRLIDLRGNQLMPVISRKRDQMLFVCDAAGTPDLFIQELGPNFCVEGKPRQIFSARRSAQGSPAFSPDSRKVAFVSNKDGSPRIYVMDIPSYGAKPADIKPRLISRQCRENTSPAWSPDGKMLAYSAMTNGVRQIWIYDFTEDREWQLTQGSSMKENPTWAPDSLHLIFNSSSLKASELYMVNLHQPEAVKISHLEGEKRFPCWELR